MVGNQNITLKSKENYVTVFNIVSYFYQLKNKVKLYIPFYFNGLIFFLRSYIGYVQLIGLTSKLQ